MAFFGRFADLIPAATDYLSSFAVKVYNIVDSFDWLWSYGSAASDVISKFANNLKLMWVGFSNDDVGLFQSGLRGLVFDVRRYVGEIVDYVASIDWGKHLATWANAFILWGGAI